MKTSLLQTEVNVHLYPGVESKLTHQQLVHYSLSEKVFRKIPFIKREICGVLTK